MAKIKGVLASILGITFSPFSAIIIVASLLDKIINLPFLEGVFWGVNLAVIVLIYLALKEMWQKSIVDLFSAFWFLLILILSILKINPAILILSSIALGVIIYFIKEKKNA